jgi:MFS family permease
VLLLLGCLLLGAGNAAAMLSRYAAADLADPDGRGRAIAAVLVASSVGAVAGANLIGVLAPISSGVGLSVYAGPYLVAAATYAVAAVLILVLLKPDPLTLARRYASTGRGGGPEAARRRQPLRSADFGGLLGLSVANLVMMGLMTLAPLELVDMGQGLGVVGGIVSMHIAAMFAPSPVSGRVADRLGAPRALTVSAVLLLAAPLTAIAGSDSTAMVATALILLGMGWNVAVVAGSVMLTTRASPQQRPQLEAVGEVTMGLAGAAGSVVSGPIVLAAGYAGLGIACAVASSTMFLLPLLELRRVRRTGRAGQLSCAPGRG